MSKTNDQLVQLMSEIALTPTEIAQCLNVPVELVGRWIAADGDSKKEDMPESELRLLQFSLMTENRLSTLF